MPRLNRQVGKFDRDYRFLLEIDPAFEEWRVLAAEWLAIKKRAKRQYNALTAFFLRYLHACQLDKRPETLFKKDAGLPDLWVTLGLDGLTEAFAKTRHDTIIDFLDWTLREKFAENDADGRNGVSDLLDNPFPRRRTKQQFKIGDSEFRFLLEIDPAFEGWRVLAVEWLASTKGAKSRHVSLTAFLVRYLHACQLDKRPVAVFEQGARLPDLWVTLGLDARDQTKAKGRNDDISDFLNWVLQEKFAVANAEGHNVVPAHLANPFPRYQAKRKVRKVDHEFRFLLEIDPDFEEWRVLVVEWLATQKRPKKQYVPLTAFFLRYLHEYQLDKRPEALFKRDACLPDLWEKLRSDVVLEDSAKGRHDAISDFLDWILREKFVEADADGRNGAPDLLANPFPRRRTKRQIERIDDEFRFLLEIDPAFEGWRVFVVEWLATHEKPKRKYVALADFLLRYLHACQLDKRPEAIFKRDARLPDLWVTLGLDGLNQTGAKGRHDEIIDFLDWVLRENFAVADAEGHTVVPVHLANPFLRRRIKQTGKGTDLGLSHVVNIDPRMEHWRLFAAEWLQGQTVNLSSRRAALDVFLVTYIIKQDLPRNPIVFLERTVSKPVFSEVLAETKAQTTGKLLAWDVGINNTVAEFIDWLLSEKLSVEDDEGRRFIPSELHNPVMRISASGVAVPTESVRSVLSIRYIKELRTMLAEGLNFRDWEWAQGATRSRRGGGDWFVVDPKVINRADPDCVWRERPASEYEISVKNYPPQVFEMWSPVRATALLLKLELPLRTFQVRMLDSGEADTWRYTGRREDGGFKLNNSRLATGSASRPYQRGVFHRNGNGSDAGLFINTNKTADVNKAETAKGYVIPWTHESVLYWLEKLRNWQERYNPIDAPTHWGSLKSKHFGYIPPHPAILEARGTACFLFRDAAAASVSDRQKPLPSSALDSLWYRLLAQLEERCAQGDEALDDGSRIKFVDAGSSATYFPLHSLRVSLITYLVLDKQLPLPVVSKLIVGHRGLLMTIYYTKCGYAYMKEVMEEAERNVLAADEANHRRFLRDATLEQVGQRFASVNDDALRAAVGHKSAAVYVFEDKGICPVGGAKCDVGGMKLNDGLVDTSYAPVPGYPAERNCVRCRFFLSGPAWLPGLHAHFNTISYEAHERAERHNDLQEAVTTLENRRNECHRDGRLFTESRELERLSQRYEEEAEAMCKLINDLQATYHLIARSLEILSETNADGVQLVAVGEMQDIQVAFAEAECEMHQVQVMCENATVHPGIDARKPAMRRGQLIDCMLEYNKIPPIFFRLSPKQQLEVGNAVMKLIQARTGSLREAVEFVEGERRLCELGILDETWDVLAANVVQTPAREIIDAARGGRALSPSKRASNAS